MQQSGQTGFLRSIARQFRRLAGAFREKPQAKLDDYMLEHFMLYHGLVGASEEDRPKFRELKTMIFDALTNQSAPQMAIALKVPALESLDQLQSIFAEALQHFDIKRIESCLLPEVDPWTAPPEHIPLKHPDWRVRANTARTLASLQMVEAVPQLLEALNDSADEQRPAFLHIAYSLAELKIPQARLGLVPHLINEEHWFRVDAAGALAMWPLTEVAQDLMKAMQQNNLLNDYMAVAITRKHGLHELLELRDSPDIEGALEVVIGLVQAANGPFASEIGRDSTMFEAEHRVVELASTNPSPRSLRAALCLSDWILQSAAAVRSGSGDQLFSRAVEAANQAKQQLSNEQSQQLVQNWFSSYSSVNEGGNEGGNEHSSDLRHALDLAARYQLSAAAPYLIPMLNEKNPAINELLDAVGALGIVDAAPKVIEIINTSVDLQARTSRELSKQPVFEENPAAAKTYWHALRALGSLPDEKALDILLHAMHDFAADKREQAISSLVRLTSTKKMLSKMSRVENAVAQALHDPSPQVRIGALIGVRTLKLSNLISDTAKLAGSKEVRVSKEAINSLKTLSQQGQKKAVHDAVQTQMSGERDQYIRQRLHSLIDSLK